MSDRFKKRRQVSSLKAQGVTSRASTWLLVDSFVGALSDFADTIVVDRFASRSAAVREVKSRIRILEENHRDFFEEDEITLPSNDEIGQSLREANCVKYTSSDGCRYSWGLYKLFQS